MAWLQRQRRDRRPVAPPVQRGSTTSIRACRLVKGAMVLTPSTPFRFRAEQVLWIDKPPFQPVVAHLEGIDPDTGATQQRWHQWQQTDMVTVFTSAVEIYEHGGNYGGLYERFGQPGEQEDLSKWHRAYG
jgi:hypothetical protein